MGLYWPTCAPWAASQPHNQVAKQGAHEVAVPRSVGAFTLSEGAHTGAILGRPWACLTGVVGMGPIP
jgi:hypothetical protein